MFVYFLTRVIASYYWKITNYVSFHGRLTTNLLSIFTLFYLRLIFFLWGKRITLKTIGLCYCLICVRKLWVKLIVDFFLFKTEASATLPGRTLFSNKNCYSFRSCRKYLGLRFNASYIFCLFLSRFWPPCKLFLSISSLLLCPSRV